MVKKINLLEKKNGKIVKNQSLDIEEFLQKIMGIEIEDIQNFITINSMKINLFNRIFRKKKLQRIRDLENFLEAYNRMKMNVIRMIDEDNIHTTKKKTKTKKK